MRPLALLLLLACSKEPAPPRAETTRAAPTPVTTPAAAPVPAPATRALAPWQRSMAMAEKCPVGDMTHVAVYHFIERELADAAKDDEGRAATRALVKHETALRHQPDMKPPRASIVEGEMSHAIGTLCAGTPGCAAVGLYNPSGLAIALSARDGIVAPLGFPDDARWAELRGAKLDDATGTAVLEPTAAELTEAGVTARARYVYVVAPAEHGLALCIVER